MGKWLYRPVVSESCCKWRLMDIAGYTGCVSASYVLDGRAQQRSLENPSPSRGGYAVRPYPFSLLIFSLLASN